MKRPVALLAFALSCSAVSPTLATDVVAYQAHIIECFGLLLTGAKEHNEVCGITKDTLAQAPNPWPSNTPPSHPDITCAPGTHWVHRNGQWICDWLN